MLLSLNSWASPVLSVSDSSSSSSRVGLASSAAIVSCRSRPFSTCASLHPAARGDNVWPYMPVPRSPHCQLKSFQIDTGRIVYSACHPSPEASTSTAPLTPPWETQRERVHLARFAILPDCMQTPDDVCPDPAVLPARLAWRVAVERETGTWDSKRADVVSRHPTSSGP